MPEQSAAGARHKRRAQATDAELKNRDAAFFSRDSIECVFGEKAQACDRSCQDENGGGKATTSGDGTAGRAAALGVDGAMAVPWRWYCLHCVTIYITSYIAFFRTGNVYSSNSWYQSSTRKSFPGRCVRARARVPSPSPPRASMGPEPAPSIPRWTIRCHSPNFLANPSTHP